MNEPIIEKREAVAANSPVKAIIAASIGNAFECYDLIIYGAFAVTISNEFFPRDNANVALLIAFATFGVSFLFRPLGGLLLGAYGDRAGRKAALVATMLLMLVGTLIIAATPPYAAIGICASILIVLGRIIQGFSAGGEFASATAFLAEQSADRRGFFASWQFASQGFSMAMAAGIAYVISVAISSGYVPQWGWRLSFLFGLLIGPALLYARSGLEETAAFRATATLAHPVRETFANEKRRVLVAVGSVILATVGVYVIVYMPTYAVRQLGLSQADGFSSTAVGGMTLFVLTPFSGALVDRYGRLSVALPFAVLLFLAPLPLYVWLSHARTAGALCLCQFLVASLMAGYLGALASFLSDLFPVATRMTGISLGYNASVMVFGGFAPFIMTWLSIKTGSTYVPGYYLALGAGCSLITLCLAWRKGYR